MKSPDAIKKSLNACSADECHGAHLDCEYTPSVLCIQNMCGDALAYIKRLAAELIAMRTELDTCAGLCNICKHEKEPKPCTAEPGCGDCESETCPCKRCYDTHGKEGFEWDGGENDDV